MITRNNIHMDKINVLLNNSLAVGVIAFLVGLGIGGEMFDRDGYGKDMRKMSDGRMMKNADMSMDAMMHGMMAGLDGKTGDAFDKAFLGGMIVHHEGAVSMAEALLKNTARPELKKLGNDIITAQKKEIEMMREWLKSWFGN